MKKLLLLRSMCTLVLMSCVSTVVWATGEGGGRGGESIPVSEPNGFLILTLGLAIAAYFRHANKK